MSEEDYEFCKDCTHCVELYYNTYICNYIFDVGKKRGCKAGVKCTKKEKVEWQEQNTTP